jgi:hypothetical protein
MDQGWLAIHLNCQLTDRDLVPKVAADGIGFLRSIKHSSYSGHDLLAKMGILAAQRFESGMPPFLIQ